MAAIGNFFWFILFGWWKGILYGLLGVIFCITIIGIPIGKALFQYAKLMLLPFGKAVIRETALKGSQNISVIRRVGGIIANILWFPFGLILCILEFLNGAVACITIVLIPFGLVCFRSAKFIITPIGAKVVKKEVAQAAMTVNALEQRGLSAQAPLPQPYPPPQMFPSQQPPPQAFAPQPQFPQAPPRQPQVSPLSPQPEPFASGAGTQGATPPPPPPVRKFCSGCGTQAQPDDMFCANCGVAIKKP